MLAAMTQILAKFFFAIALNSEGALPTQLTLLTSGTNQGRDGRACRRHPLVDRACDAPHRWQWLLQPDRVRDQADMIRRSKAPSPPVEKTTLERAAIGVCRLVYGARCSCDRSPSACRSMLAAAKVAVSIAAPEAAEQLLKEQFNSERKA